MVNLGMDQQRLCKDYLSVDPGGVIDGQLGKDLQTLCKHYL